MSNMWAERQRRTNALVRRVGIHVLKADPDSNQLFGLCKLTWITNSYEGENPAYVRSTKIPALSDVSGISMERQTLPLAASLVSTTFGDPELESLILAETGFTNFYKAYRNSARLWIDTNRSVLTEIFREALALHTDEQGERLAIRIASLPPIPKANHPNQRMRPDFLVTPVCFALDPRLRFPIINGAERVQVLLRRIGALDSTPAAKYLALVSLIGRGGVKDAADLDQLGLADQLDLISNEDEQLRYLLEEQPEEGNDLPSKEEEEVKRLQRALSGVQRRLHNKMTNQLRNLLSSWTLLEGKAEGCKYDVLIRNYDRARNDLLIEVKSSTDPSQIRMAIGQVYAYWHRLNGPTTDVHCAILLPSQPSNSVVDLLGWLEIGVLWIEQDQLRTTTEWLRDFVNDRQRSS